MFPERAPEEIVRRNLAVRRDWTRLIRNLRNGVFASHRYHGNGKNPTEDNTVKKAGTFHLGASLSSWLQQTSCVSVVHRASRELPVFAEIVGAASESPVTSEAQRPRG